MYSFQYSQVLSISIVFNLLIKDSNSLNCHKCYRFDDYCLNNPKINCTQDVYQLINYAYRHLYYMNPKESLSLCPPENIRTEEDEYLWLELGLHSSSSSGNCGSSKYSYCSISRFHIIDTRTFNPLPTKYFGVFLGCPKPILYESILRNYGCKQWYRKISTRSKSDKSELGFQVDQIMFGLEQCNYNCTNSLYNCDLCKANDFCIFPNNTRMRNYLIRNDLSDEIPITLIIFGFTLIIVMSLLAKHYCQGQAFSKYQNYGNVVKFYELLDEPNNDKVKMKNLNKAYSC